MKTKIHRVTLALSAIAAGALFAGCTTTRTEVSQQMGVQAYADEVSVAQNQLDRTIDSLDQVMDASEAELPVEFNLFSNNMTQLQLAAADAQQAAAAMQLRGQSYFRDWDARIAMMDNEDIRADSKARRDEVLETFSETAELYANATRELSAVVSDLEDVRAHLAADLSLAGVEVIEDEVADLDDDSAEVLEMLANLEVQFDEMGAGFPSTTRVASDVY